MILNPFATDAFNLVSLTRAINILPNMYGRLREIDLFPARGITTRTAIVEEQNGVLNLLPTMPVGAPGTQNKIGKRKVRSFVVPHIPMDDVILPQEFDNVREFGTENTARALSSVMNNHLQTAKNKFAITLEHLRMGALKGIILDADGSTLYNLYSEFQIPAFSVDFVLGTTTTNILKKCLDITRHIEDNLHGEVMSEVRALVSAEFFDNLTSHANVVKVFQNTSLAFQMLGGDIRKNFKFGGITFEEYRGTATDISGTAHRFIASNEGHAFPMGTMSAFETVYAPADFLETVNTVGLELYAKQQMRDFNRGVDLHTQSNPLPLCYRPSLLVKVFSSN